MGQGKGRKVGLTKKQIKELYATYGQLNLFNSGKFHPYTRNLTTGKILQRSHHCEQCNAKMTQSCYLDLHHAFCPTWVTRIHNGERVRERCGERFALRSDGCGKHPRVQGCNEPFYRAAAGEDIDLAEFDDKDPLNLKGAPEDDENQYEADMEELDRLAEDIIATKGYLPADFYANFWKDRAKEVSMERSNQDAAAKNAEPETMSEERKEGSTAAGRGQGNIRANGKKGVGKKNRKGTITFADASLGKNGQGRHQ